MTALVDLTSSLAFPGAPDTETAQRLAEQAKVGGFSHVVVAPEGGPSTLEALSAFYRTLSDAAVMSGVALIPAPQPVVGGELAELYSLARGEVPLSVVRLTSPLADTQLLARVFEAARALQLLVIVPAMEPALSTGAVCFEGAVATRLGLPSVPAASEAIGVSRTLELAAWSGARVHIAHLATARGVALVAAAMRSGVQVSACVRASHLVTNESQYLQSPYDTRYRVFPPLCAEADQQALLAAVQARTLLVSTGHYFVPKRERDLEMAVCPPGGPALEGAFADVAALVGEATAKHAMADGPRRVLFGQFSTAAASASLLSLQDSDRKERA